MTKVEHTTDRWCGICKLRTTEQLCPVCFHRWCRSVPTNPYDETKHKPEKKEGTP